MFYQNVRSSHIPTTFQEQSSSSYESDENRQPNNQIRSIETPNQTAKMSSMDYLSGRNQSLINDVASKDNAQELNILIRRVGMEDHLNIVKLFQVCFE